MLFALLLMLKCTVQFQQMQLLRAMNRCLVVSTMLLSGSYKSVQAATSKALFWKRGECYKNSSLKSPGWSCTPLLRAAPWKLWNIWVCSFIHIAFGFNSRRLENRSWFARFQGDALRLQEMKLFLWNPRRNGFPCCPGLHDAFQALGPSARATLLQIKLCVLMIL